MNSVILFLCAFVLCAVRANEENTAVDELLANYDLAPPGGKVEVRVKTYIRNIEYVSSHNRNFKVQLNFRQRWTDRRLEHTFQGRDYLNIDPGRIWTPDIFFFNELESSGHQLMAGTTLLRVSREGEVLLSRRITLVLSCPMDLFAFPFDTQACSVIISSWGSTSDQLSLSWQDSKSVSIAKAVSMSDFSLTKINTSGCDYLSPTGSYSCVMATLTLQRDARYYMILIYIPLAMCVLISWLSYWICSSPIRITLLMFDLTGAGALIHSVNNSVPATGYAKSLDCYTGISLIFLFVALIEFVVVQYTFKRELQNEKIHCMMNDVRSNVLDRMCRLLIPIFFILFVLTYFFMMVLI